MKFACRHLVVPQPPEPSTLTREQTGVLLLRGSLICCPVRLYAGTDQPCKFLIRNLVRRAFVNCASGPLAMPFQQALFGDDAATQVAVTDQYAFGVSAQATTLAATTTGASAIPHFRKHFCGRMGDFDSKENSRPCQLDMWRSGAASRSGCATWFGASSSFFLQKADGRFLSPDFLCQLHGSGTME